MVSYIEWQEAIDEATNSLYHRSVTNRITITLFATFSKFNSFHQIKLHSISWSYKYKTQTTNMKLNTLMLAIKWFYIKSTQPLPTTAPIRRSHI